jgi:hypothetical protein
MKPTIGRIVIYNDGNRDFAAIITRVHNDTCVNLAGFGDHQTTYVTSATSCNGESVCAHSWRWPSRD